MTTTSDNRNQDTIARLLAPLTSNAARHERNAKVALLQRIHALRGLQDLLDDTISDMHAEAEAADGRDGRNPLWPTVAEAGHLMTRVAEALGYEAPSRW